MKSNSTRLAGWVCVAAALWFGIGAYISNGKPTKAEKGIRNTRVTKPHPREVGRPGDRVMRTKNPREEFEGARKRGLTEGQVRRIIEEYLELGIASDTAVEEGEANYWKRRGKQQKWLMDTLAEGFGLTVEQRVQAEAQLMILAKEDFVECKKKFVGTDIFKRTSTRSEDIGIGFNGTRQMTGEQLVTPAVWLREESFAPWNLCDLTVEQKEIGWGDVVEEFDSYGKRVARTKDFGTEYHYEYRNDLVSVYAWLIPEAGRIFPVSMAQADRMREIENSFHLPDSERRQESIILNEVKCLSAPQLKTLLLCNPDWAARLLSDPEK